MEKYIHNENIRQFQKLLEEETDAHKRETIRQLLSKEKSKEALAKPRK